MGSIPCTGKSIASSPQIPPILRCKLRAVQQRPHKVGRRGDQGVPSPVTGERTPSAPKESQSAMEEEVKRQTALPVLVLHPQRPEDRTQGKTQGPRVPAPSGQGQGRSDAELPLASAGAGSY